MSYVLPAEALKRLDTYIAEDRIIRHKWTGADAEGRETACLLAALDPDRINAVDRCPAEWLPAWLAHLTPSFDDHASEAAWPGVIRRYQRVLHYIHRLTPEGSERAMWRTIDASLEIAEPHDRADVVAPVRALIARQLAGDRPSDAEWRAASKAAVWAARAAEAARAASAASASKAAARAASAASAARAARAAWAAEAAAEAAARAARAAWAAEAAAEAAVWAARAASAAWASAAAAWDRIADACLGALEAELGLEPL